MSAAEKFHDEPMAEIHCPRCHAFLCRMNGAIEIKCRRCGRLLRFLKKCGNRVANTLHPSTSAPDQNDNVA